MCGRYVITKPVSKTKGIVKSVIGVEDDENYNAHPKQNLPVIKPYTNGKTLESLQWGLTPSWAREKDIKPLINARLETIREKISCVGLNISPLIFPATFVKKLELKSSKIPYRNW